MIPVLLLLVLALVIVFLIFMSEYAPLPVSLNTAHTHAHTHTHTHTIMGLWVCDHDYGAVRKFLNSDTFYFCFDCELQHIGLENERIHVRLKCRLSPFISGYAHSHWVIGGGINFKSEVLEYRAEWTEIAPLSKYCMWLELFSQRF